MILLIPTIPAIKVPKPITNTRIPKIKVIWSTALDSLAKLRTLMARWSF